MKLGSRSGLYAMLAPAVGFIAVSGVATLNGLVLMQAIRERLDGGLDPTAAAVDGRPRPNQ